jgi:hypothetical protein
MEASRTLLRERLFTLAWLVVASAFLLVQLGYSFESNDQVQYLLLPYRAIYPDFLPGDWFTWSTSHYHLTFAWIVRAIHAVCGESRFRFGLFGAHVATLAWLAYAVLRLSRTLSGGMFEASVPLFVFACARDEGIGGAIFNHGCLLPSDLALAPFLLACAACLDRRAIATGVWLGIAGFLHANFAVLGPVVILPLAMIQAWPELRAASAAERNLALRALARTLILYAVLASPSLILLASSFLARDSDPAAIAITLFVRSPHHYDLAFMSARDFYWMGLVAILALPAFVGRYAVPRAAAAACLCGLLSGLIAIGLLGAGLHMVPLARLFTLRMSIPLLVVLFVLIARVAREIVTAAFAKPQDGRKQLGAFVWLAAALCTLAMFVREDLLTLAPFRDPPQVPDPTAPGMPVWLIASVFAPLLLATIALIVPRRPQLAMLAAVPLLVSLWVAHIPLGPMWTGARLRAARSFHFRDRRIELAAPASDLSQKARALTPNDARFLIPPGLFEFRMRARRSVFVDWKCAPMKGDEAAEWKRRMLIAIGADDFPSRGYSLPQRSDALYYARPLRDLIALAQRERLTHIIIRKPQLTKSLGGASVAFTSGSYVVLRLPNPS